MREDNVFLLVEHKRLVARPCNGLKDPILCLRLLLLFLQEVFELLEHLAVVEDLLVSQLVDDPNDFPLALPHEAVMKTVHHQEIAIAQYRVESGLKVLQVVQSNQDPPDAERIAGTVGALGMKVDEFNSVEGCARVLDVIPVVFILPKVLLLDPVRVSVEVKNVWLLYWLFKKLF